MNLTALKRLTANWSGIGAAAAAFRSGYVRATGCRTPLSVYDGWHFSELLSHLPLYAKIRNFEPVSVEIADLYKSALGSRLAFRELAIFGTIAQVVDRDTEIEARTLVDFVEDRGMLVGSSEVCAGPARLIEEFLDIVINGSPEKGNLGRAADQVLSEIDDALRFASICGYLHVYKRLIIFRVLRELQQRQCFDPSALKPIALEAGLDVESALWTTQAREFEDAMVANGAPFIWLYHLPQSEGAQWLERLRTGSWREARKGMGETLMWLENACFGQNRSGLNSGSLARAALESLLPMGQPAWKALVEGE